MKYFARTVVAAVVLCTAPLSAHAGTGQLTKAHPKLPLSFIQNQGQLDSATAFAVSGPRGWAHFTHGSIAFELSKPGAPDRTCRMRIGLAGANTNARIDGVGKLQGTVNYLIGRNSSDWKTGVPTYGAVTYTNVWPGIKLIYRGDAGRLKYDAYVSPGASLSRIRFTYAGVDGMSISKSGDLVVRTPVGSFTEGRPGIYQVVGGRKIWLKGGFTLDGNTVGFRVSNYNRSLPLVIDPASDIAWSTFLGGSGWDEANAMAIDGSRCLYVAGLTQSSDFPATSGAYDVSYDGTADNADAFVAKLNATGTALLYATYIGGSDWDEVRSIAVDSSGCAYLAGSTKSTDFPASAGAPYTTQKGGFDGFVAKLSADGSALLYATYLGGADWDEANAIAVDSAGCAYVAGYANSSDYPTTSGAYQTTSNSPGNPDAFVTKINAAGSGLVYSTYLGGSWNDCANSIAVDASGCAYVAGGTNSNQSMFPGFPVTLGAYKATAQASNTGDHSFVTKLNASGSGLTYSTLLARTGVGDEANAIAVDSTGYAYIAGKNLDALFPWTPGAFKVVSTEGGSSCYIVKLNTTGTAAVYSGYVGGGRVDTACAIAVDSAGSATIAGYTESSQFYTTADALDRTHNGPTFVTDAFVTRINPAGSAITYSTLLGSSGEDFASAIALDSFGDASVAGTTSGSDFPTTPGSLKTTIGYYDGFVTRLPLLLPMGISAVRQAGTGASVKVSHGVVTAASTDYFYVESDNRTSGIRVEKAAHGLSKGMRAEVLGVAGVNSDGEWCIAATLAAQDGTGSLEPLALNNQACGGGLSGGQAAVLGWTLLPDSGGVLTRQPGPEVGLNNIGLLVRTSGKVKEIGSDSFTIDDGYGINIQVVIPTSVSLPSVGNFALVTGVSSCYRDGTNLRRQVLVRQQSDIVELTMP